MRRFPDVTTSFLVGVWLLVLIGAATVALLIVGGTAALVWWLLT